MLGQTVLSLNTLHFNMCLHCAKRIFDFSKWLRFDLPQFARSLASALSLSLSTCWPLDIQITNQLCCITQNKLTYLQSSTRANDIFSVFTTYGLNGLEHFRARQTVPTKLATMNVIEFHRVKILKQMTHTHTSESQFHFGLRAR